MSADGGCCQESSTYKIGGRLIKQVFGCIARALSNRGRNLAIPVRKQICPCDDGYGKISENLRVHKLFQDGKQARRKGYGDFTVSHVYCIFYYCCSNREQGSAAMDETDGC